MHLKEQELSPESAKRPEGGPPELSINLVPWSGQVPEPLAAFFRRLTPWTWRHLRTVFCRFQETRRLANILRTIDLILGKAPQTLARGHWSIAGYQEARRNLESAIIHLGHLANQVAADARIRRPVGPERTKEVPRKPGPSPRRPPARQAA